MKSKNKHSLRLAGIAASFAMLTGLFSITPAVAAEESILLINDSITPTSSGILREIAARNIVQPINGTEGRTVITIKADAEDNSALVIIQPDYNLGGHGESLRGILNALNQYGFVNQAAIT